MGQGTVSMGRGKHCLPCPAPRQWPQVTLPPGEKEQNLDHWEDTLLSVLFLPLSRLWNKLGAGDSSGFEGPVIFHPSVQEP